MKTHFEIRTDGHGDIFVTGFNKYMRTSPLAQDHLNQLADNYEAAFGEAPTPEKLNAALEFVSKFFAEVGEIHPRSQKARAASELSFLIGDDAVETAEKLADIVSPPLTAEEKMKRREDQIQRDINDILKESH